MNKRHLQIEQLDKRFKSINKLREVSKPENGWIHNIRTSLGMTLSQLGKRLGISAQSVQALEVREAEGKITLNNLQDAADALEMQLVYAIIPKGKSLSALLDQKVTEKAKEIISRTSHNMLLEDQQNSSERLKKEFKRLTGELRTKLPKYLWD